MAGKAESNVHKASIDASRTTQQLDETIDEFQKQKLKDIQKIFLDFVTIEMVFHTKAVEVYSSAFQTLQSYDLEKDLEDFRAKIHIASGTFNEARPVAATNPSSGFPWSTGTQSVQSTLQKLALVESDEEPDKNQSEDFSEPEYTQIKREASRTR